jgi:hypothetical protein
MYSFIPRLPTKEAWENKAFQPQPTLQSIVAAMKEKPRFFTRGQLKFRSAGPDDSTNYQSFSGTTDLALQLEAIKWNPATIAKIVIYEYGYFIINPDKASP